MSWRRYANSVQRMEALPTSCAILMVVDHVRTPDGSPVIAPSMARFGASSASAARWSPAPARNDRKHIARICGPVPIVSTKGGRKSSSPQSARRNRAIADIMKCDKSAGTLATLDLCLAVGMRE